MNTMDYYAWSWDGKNLNAEKWYCLEHRIKSKSLPKKLFERTLIEGRRRGRPRKTRKGGTRATILTREKNIDGDWENRKLMRLRYKNKF